MTDLVDVLGFKAIFLQMAIVDFGVDSLFPTHFPIEYLWLLVTSGVDQQIAAVLLRG